MPLGGSPRRKAAPTHRSRATSRITRVVKESKCDQAIQYRFACYSPLVRWDEALQLFEPVENDYELGVPGVRHQEKTSIRSDVVGGAVEVSVPVEGLVQNQTGERDLDARSRGDRNRIYIAQLPDHIIDRPSPEPPVLVKEIDEGTIVETDKFKVTAREVVHLQPLGFERSSYGYRIDSEYGSAAFSGDTEPCDAMVELSKDVLPISKGE